MATRVFLVDDHTVVREGLRAILNQQPDISVVGEAGDGREGIRKCRELNPDVVLMDIALPGLNGIEVTRQIRKQMPSCRVVILSIHSSREHLHQAFKAGASGYLRKDSSGREVVDAVRTVQKGRRYLGLPIMDDVVDGFLLSEIGQASSPLERLSVREQEVFQLVVSGKSSAQIGELIYLSPKTVETYRSRLMKKLGVNDLPSLVRFAIQHKLIDSS